MDEFFNPIRFHLLISIRVLLIVAIAGMFSVPASLDAFADNTQASQTIEEPSGNIMPVELVSIVTSQGRFEFTAEIADDEQERARGLMFRETMPAKHGMLFDFGQTRRIQMWMRNTPLSLDMIFIDPTGQVVNIAERTTPFSDAIIDSMVPVSHVLEVNAGISRLIGLKIGDRIVHSDFE